MKFDTKMLNVISNLKTNTIKYYQITKIIRREIVNKETEVIVRQFFTKEFAQKIQLASIRLT